MYQGHELNLHVSIQYFINARILPNVEAEKCKRVMLGRWKLWTFVLGYPYGPINKLRSPSFYIFSFSFKKIIACGGIASRNSLHSSGNMMELIKEAGCWVDYGGK